MDEKKMFDAMVAATRELQAVFTAAGVPMFVGFKVGQYVFAGGSNAPATVPEGVAFMASMQKLIAEKQIAAIGGQVCDPGPAVLHGAAGARGN